MSEAFRFGMNKSGSGTCHLESDRGHRAAPKSVVRRQFPHSNGRKMVLTVSIPGGS